ncbi:MAG: hypothetical protein ACN4G0_05460 [Polyangiales bacterium]
MLRTASLLFPVAFVLTSASACDGSQEPDIEILRTDSLAVLVSEANGAPVAALAEQRILAGQQYVLLSRFDGGERNERLVELNLRPGPQQIDLGDDDEPVVVAFEAVSEDEIVDIELLRADEAELTPGTWVEVDLVGVTEDGERVRSMHPRFETGSETHLGYFAYRFDPDAAPQTLTVDALDRRVHAQFRGRSRARE